MQRQETGLDGPAGGSPTALKPIKATWVCSHAWLQRWPGGVYVRVRACLCVYVCVLGLRGGQEEQAVQQD